MKLKNVADIYPLGPLQEGILFHVVADQHAGHYHQQLCCTIEGEFDIPTFKKAWDDTINRYDVLRTIFLWQGLERPLQVVRKTVKPKWQEEDWTQVSENEKQEKLQYYIEKDRYNGFRITHAPLMRFFIAKSDSDKLTFVWSFHHLLLDGWSIPIIWKDVLDTYDAIINNQPIPRKQPAQFNRFIEWYLNLEHSEAGKFWTDYLKGFSTPSSPDGLRGLKQGDAPGRCAVQLSGDETKKLKKVAADYNLTLNSIAQTVWALLLSIYCHNDDVVFGSTVAGRPIELPDSDSMAGLFINTLPMRMKVDPELPFYKNMLQLQNNLLTMREFEQSSLLDIQGWSEVPRGESLFETAFIFENYPEDKPGDTGSYSITNVTVQERTHFPLSILAGTVPDFRVEIAWDGKRFGKQTASMIADHFYNVLHNFIADPDILTRDVSLLSKVEADHLDELNETAKAYPTEKILPDYLAEYGAQFPDKTAVICREDSINYRQLNQKVQLLSALLVEKEIVAGDKVGIYLSRSIDMVVAALAVMRSGAVYIPLDPAFPKDRLSYMVEDAGIQLILTETAFLKNTPAAEADHICLDRDVSESLNTNLVNVPVQPDSCAYVIYTSGSTGKPKGVQISHRALMNFLHSMKLSPGFNENDTLLAVTTLSFDISGLELYLPLLCGGTVDIVPSEGVVNGEELIRRIEEKQISIMQATPATWRLLLESGWQGKKDLRILCGGEAFPEDLAAELIPRSSEVWNMYGPTETTIWSTIQQLKAGEDVHIGRPIANTQIYIVDWRGERAPLGVAGELCIGGDGVAIGYLDRPELNVDRFIINKKIDSKRRIYRTGDLARYYESGDIEFLGRFDHQLKLRGFRIESGEIESCLVEIDSIDRAIVAIHEYAKNDKRLIAYLVGEDIPEVVDIKKLLREKLPEYMIPAHFFSLHEIPLTPNNKVDRKALPKPEALTDSVENIIPPSTELEETLLGIWQNVLQQNPISVDSNFFDLGGHSLLAVRLIGEINTACSGELTIGRLFEMPTIRGLAKLLEEQSGSDNSMDFSQITEDAI